MTVTPELTLMTTEELLDLPEDGVDRELIRGVLRERPMTRRNPRHAGTEARIATLLSNWVMRQPSPRGRVYSGEVGVRLRRNPDTTVGIDVAYFSADAVAANAAAVSLLEGPPVVAVEILSPSDVQEDVLDKVAEYLDAGVKLVWVVEPRFRTVTVYQRGADPVMFNATQELDGGPHLPGFRVAVAELFTD